MSKAIVIYPDAADPLWLSSPGIKMPRQVCSTLHLHDGSFNGRQDFGVSQPNAACPTEIDPL
ncbi:hypothetical protein [Egbenema bharatensis]|uniref:hypothetical protein n=1 Tax=Egbenema bharatensis TaxID=3463334 RepID=UPI003A8C1F20